MKERGILFSAPMVRAILDGRKTVTRRLVKPSPGLQRTWLTHDTIQKVPHGEIARSGERVPGEGPWGWQTHHPLAGTKQPYGGVEHDSPLGWVKSPFGGPGDRLWVREPFIAFDEERVHYKADFDSDSKGDKEHGITWAQSSMMPRWASRLLLEVIALRVERLHEITEEDAKAEGLQMSDVCVGYLPRALEMGLLRYEFANRWSDSNKRYPWASNPYVWRVEFRKAT